MFIFSGFGGICGVPIGFGFTTTVGGSLDPFTDDLYGGSLSYGPGYGFTASGLPSRGIGGFNRGIGRAPYRQLF